MKRLALRILALLAIPSFCAAAKSNRLSTNSSIIAIDCAKQRAYVARKNLNGNGHGQIAVINLAANPNKKDPRITSIDLGHADFPIGVALDPVGNQIVVVSGNNGSDGKLDLIQESSNTLVPGSPFPFPSGSDTGDVGQVVVDPIRNKAIVAMIKTGDGSSDSAGPHTGFAIFDLQSKTGSIIQAASSDGFAFDPVSGILISPEDKGDPTQDAINTLNGASCTLDDSNLSGDTDHAAFDSSTHLVVIGNDGDHRVSVINLNGASFSGTSAPCTLDEAGSTPNSVAATGWTMEQPGNVAVNPVTHQAIVEGSDENGVGLLTLPKKAVAQLSSDMVTFVETTMPNAPDNTEFDFKGFPYTAAIDSCHNQGYGRNESDTFLARVDLKKLAKKTSVIHTALPAGNCKGTQTTLACSNKNGVTFYPLP